MSSGFRIVAFHAIRDVDRKKMLKLDCIQDGLCFKKMWKFEEIKRVKKKDAMKRGLWKSRLSIVSFIDDPLPTSSTNRSKFCRFQKGRFIVTVDLS